MATCPQCFVGLCKRHPLQDSGQRRSNLLAQEKTLNKLHSSLVKEQLSRLQSKFGNAGTSRSDLQSYKDEMGQQRRKAEARPEKEMTKEERRLAGTALNGHTLHIMSRDSVDEDERQVRREKKARKKEKKREKKARKKEKKARKKDKQRKKSRSRTPPRSGAAEEGSDEEEPELDPEAGERLTGTKRPRSGRSDSTSSDSSDSEPEAEGADGHGGGGGGDSSGGSGDGGQDEDSERPRKKVPRELLPSTANAPARTDAVPAAIAAEAQPSRSY